MKLHPMLQRQLKKSGVSLEATNNELNLLVKKINKAYIEFDQNAYLRERAMALSSKEMQELYKKLKDENIILAKLNVDLEAKDNLLIKEKKETERQSKYITAILNSVPEEIFILDEKFNIIEANETAEEKIGIKSKEMKNKSISQFFSEKEVVENLNDLIKEDEGKNKVINFQTMMTYQDKKIPVFVSINKLYKKYVGKENQIILVAKNISELKKLEKENKEKLMMLMHAGRLTSLGEMATAIAHELNQPLSVINMNLQTLEMLHKEGIQEFITNQDLTELLSDSIKQVNRADNIIRQMRKFARKNKDLDTKPEPIDIITAIEAALSMFHEQFRVHNIKVETEYSQKCKKVIIDEQELEQVMVNLLANAKYALFAKQDIESSNATNYEMKIRIELSSSDEKGKMILKVSDNGIGMSQKVKEHCFEPFFTTKKVGEGTGLGLSIIYNIIKNANGDIEIESEQNKGTTFTITFICGDKNA